jgi:hypothetical protein
MAQIICYKEGRVGFHVGDVLDIPDEVDVIDGSYFRRVDASEQTEYTKVREDKKKKELAELQKQLDDADTDGMTTTNPDAADPADGE